MLGSSPQPTCALGIQSRENGIEDIARTAPRRQRLEEAAPVMHRSFSLRGHRLVATHNLRDDCVTSLLRGPGLKDDPLLVEAAGEARIGIGKQGVHAVLVTGHDHQQVALELRLRDVADKGIDSLPAKAAAAGAAPRKPVRLVNEENSAARLIHGPQHLLLGLADILPHEARAGDAGDRVRGQHLQILEQLAKAVGHSGLASPRGPHKDHVCIGEDVSWLKSVRRGRHDDGLELVHHGDDVLHVVEARKCIPGLLDIDLLRDEIRANKDVGVRQRRHLGALAPGLISSLLGLVQACSLGSFGEVEHGPHGTGVSEARHAPLLRDQCDDSVDEIEILKYEATVGGHRYEHLLELVVAHILEVHAEIVDVEAAPEARIVVEHVKHLLLVTSQDHGNIGPGLAIQLLH